MKTIYYVIIAILIPFTMYALMHAPVFGTDCKPGPFAHCHFGIFTPNPIFLIIPSYAQELIPDPDPVPEFAPHEESVSVHTVGKIEWLEWNVQSKIPVYKIQVTDQDMDENSDEIDKFDIHIWSDSDPVGIIVPTHETEKNSGIFYSIIYFSEEPSTGQRLHVSDGGVVTAKYDDNTLSSPSEKLEIFDTMTIYYPVIDENQNPFIRIADDSFTKQHLLTGKSMSPNPNDFRESGDSIGMLYAYSGLSIVGIIVGFFVIKKWKNRK